MQPSWRWYPLRKKLKKRNHSLITVLLPAKSENPFRPHVCGSRSFVFLSIDENSKRTFFEFNKWRHITQNQTEKNSLFLSRPLTPPPPPATPPLFSSFPNFLDFNFFKVAAPYRLIDSHDLCSLQSCDLFNVRIMGQLT